MPEVCKYIVKVYIVGNIGKLSKLSKTSSKLSFAHAKATCARLFDLLSRRINGWRKYIRESISYSSADRKKRKEKLSWQRHQESKITKTAILNSRMTPTAKILWELMLSLVVDLRSISSSETAVLDYFEWSPWSMARPFPRLPLPSMEHDLTVRRDGMT